MTTRDPGELDVDARFLLANERTLLAWERTALTLIAGGVGVEQFATSVEGRTAFAAMLLVLGVASAVVGGTRFRRADAALRTRELPETGIAAYGLAAAVALLGAGLGLGLLLG